MRSRFALVGTATRDLLPARNNVDSMVPGSSGPPTAELGPDERDRLATLRAAESLSDLAALTGADDEREAYRAARREWAALRERELADRAPEGVPGPDGPPRADGLPGNRVAVGDREFFVHGITHADTSAERAFLRDHVSRFLDRDAAVYCEQGVRSMYFADLPAVCEMDDLSWALRECERLDGDPPLAGAGPAEFAASTVDDLAADVDSLADRFRRAVFSFVESNSDCYGEGVSVALGELASALLTSRADAATGDDYESFVRTRRAAEDPDALAALQRYYETTFLPQPVEREWLRRTDPELELLTHARNERMAAYAVYHVEDADEVHLLAGAAHQPGITYYLDRYREGTWSPENFELVG